MADIPSILIVEDELITAESIAELLEEEDYVITGRARDAATALRICNTAPRVPDVVICDINIKGPINGIALAGELKRLFNCELVFLTALSDPKTLQSAFAAEPVMYVVKPYTDKQLLVAVQMAFHRIFLRSRERRQDRLQLTGREVEVARLVAQGLSSKQIARMLSISVETVKTHRRRMLQKNNISSFPHLIYLMNREE
ncbi:MAG: DNA-binding response regulator [Chitinophagaceae bacterium]